MNEQLEHDLDRLAATFDVRAGDVEAVVGRARQRRRRRQRVSGVLAVAAVVAGTVAVVRAVDQPDESTIATEGGDARIGDAGIDWELVDAERPLGMLWSTAPVATAGSLYAVSTAPGEATPDREPARVIWRSDDGVDWTLGSNPADLYVSDIAATAQQLYAVGTGTASARTPTGQSVPTALVGWSAADGDDWERTTLPLDLDGMAEKTTALRVSPQDVAAGPEGVVAVVNVGAELDVASLVPDLDAPNGYAVTETGVDILGDDDPCPPGTESVAKGEEPVANRRVFVVGCAEGEGDEPEDAQPKPLRAYEPAEARGVIAHYDWRDLGVDGDLLDAVLNRPFVFHAPAGSDVFERVELPLGHGLYGQSVLVQADDEGFDLVASFATAVGRSDGASQATVTALRSSDGRAWSGSGADLAGVAWVAAIGRLDGTLAVLGGAFDGSPTFAHLVDGSWRTTSLRELIGEESGIAQAAIGPLGVVVSAISFSPNGDGPEKPGTDRWHLLASRDGRTWSTEDLGELVDAEQFQVLRVTIVQDRAIVAVAFPKERGAEHQRQAVLVGTPR